MAQGTGAITAAAGLAIRRGLNWGDYRLELEAAGGVRTVAAAVNALAAQVDQAAQALKAATR